jgi:hypothetical protein
VRVALVEQQHAADHLHDVDPGLGAQAVGDLEAIGRALTADLHLHELVISQRLLHLLDDRLGHSRLSDLNDGGHRVPVAPQGTSQLTRWHQSHAPHYHSRVRRVLP